MELFFLLLLIALMAGALGSGYPVAFALPGASIITLVLAGLTGYLITGDQGAYFSQGDAWTWLSSGNANLRGTYWVPERDTLIAIPLFIFMGIMLQRSKIAEDLLLTMANLFGPVRGGLGVSVVFVGALLAATTGIVGATVVVQTVSKHVVPCTYYRLFWAVWKCQVDLDLNHHTQSHLKFILSLITVMRPINHLMGPT